MKPPQKTLFGLVTYSRPPLPQVYLHVSPEFLFGSFERKKNPYGLFSRTSSTRTGERGVGSPQFSHHANRIASDTFGVQCICNVFFYSPITLRFCPQLKILSGSSHHRMIFQMEKNRVMAYFLDDLQPQVCSHSSL